MLQWSRMARHPPLRERRRQPGELPFLPQPFAPVSAWAYMRVADESDVRVADEPRPALEWVVPVPCEMEADAP